jgi:F-type H+-transporting ATPase subunit a
MTNLFSIFDPLVLGLPLNWLSAFSLLLLLPGIFWLVKNQLFTGLATTFSLLFRELNAVIGSRITPGGTMICVAFFGFIVFNNFLGLFPYIFTASRHLTFTVRLALPLWLGHMCIAWSTTPLPMLAHLVPSGTPYALTPFIVLIELTRRIIRPLTLSVRLAANIVAGHLLLTLLSSQASNPLFSISFLVVSALVLLSVLESAVAVIQAYVFSILSSLYVNEVNSHHLSI